MNINYSTQGGTASAKVAKRNIPSALQLGQYGTLMGKQAQTFKAKEATGPLVCCAAASPGALCVDLVAKG